MNPRKQLYLKGTFTTLEVIYGKNMNQLENMLGFANGRFSKGIMVYAAKELPDISVFKFASTTQWNTEQGIANMKGLNNNENIKSKYIQLLQTNPQKRLVKVVPILDINHQIPFMYPSGTGVNQIKIEQEILCELISVLTYYPGAVFIPNTYQLPPDMKILA